MSLFCSSHPLGVIVRAAQLKDLSQLTNVLFISFHPYGSGPCWLQLMFRLGIHEDLKQRLATKPSHNVVLVAVNSQDPRVDDRSQVVGAIELSFRATSMMRFHSNPHPYLSNLAVHPEYRRQGIAQKLLVACEEMVMDRGFASLYLHVLENNSAAQQLYFKAGYQLNSIDCTWCPWSLRYPRRLLFRKHFNF